MKITCKKNNVFDIHKTDRVEQIFKFSDGQLNIEIEKTYNVHGVIFDKDEPWFYIYLDDEDEYFDLSDTPSAYPASLFDVVDGTIPPFWELNMDVIGNFDGVMLGFKEWVTNHRFFFYAVEGRQEELEIMNKYRQKVIQIGVEQP
ncbi:MAG: hypothetical protein AB8B80_05300 [Marinicellaceae bacterium]